MSPIARATSCVLICLATAAAAAAQTASDLGNLSLEELLKLEVTSVSRRPQTIASAPAAIFVLTHDDIRRSGLTSLPEVLRLAPGVQVARYNNSRWSVSARGMGTYYSNKLLVLIDGRSVYTPDFAGVYWDLHELPLDDVERIEVIRGPGGTMWGANAVNGVINITTRTAAATQGAQVQVTGGTSNHALASFRYGGRAGAHTTYRAYGKMSDRDSHTAAPYHDSLRMYRAGLRLDSERNGLSWTVQSDAFRGTTHSPIVQPTLATPYSEVLADTIESSGAYVLGRVARQLSPRHDVAVKAYYDHNRRDEHIHGFTSDTFDVDFQHRARVSTAHDLMWGAEYRHTTTNIDNTAPVMEYNPGRSLRHLASLFAQDEIALHPTLSFIAGTKIEYHDTIGMALEPNVRALWTPISGHRVWGSVSRGVRTPSLADQIARFDYTVVAPSAQTKNLPVLVRVAGDPALETTETVVAYEAGYRAQWRPTLAVDVALFRNQYTDLTSFGRGAAAFSTDRGVPHLAVVSTHLNQTAGESHGLESVVTWTPVARATFTGSATFLKTNLHITDPTVQAGDSLLVLLLSPERQFTARAALRLTSSVDLDANVWWNGAWQRGNVESYWRTDVRAGWTIDPSVTLDFGVQNLLDDRHLEATRYLYEYVTEVPRTGYARLTWRF